jgi:hypothetical protein
MKLGLKNLAKGKIKTRKFKGDQHGKTALAINLLRIAQPSEILIFIHSVSNYVILGLSACATNYVDTASLQLPVH